jgi:adenosylhomocysteine nucleosidase
MKILVTFALENEFSPWRDMRKFRSARWGKTAVYSTEIGGAEVAVALTGVGARVAALHAQDVMKANGASIQLCVSSGFAGALRSEHTVGQVLAAKGIRSDTPHRERDTNVLECSGALLSFAAECGATVVRRFYTSERAIGTPDEKEHLAQLADAVEMESFAILAEAAASGIPGIAIRAISDLAREALPLDMNEVFTDKGEVSMPRVLGQVARHPGAMPGLMRLGRQSKAAAESLAQFLDRYVATVAERTVALGAGSAGG